MSVSTARMELRIQRKIKDQIGTLPDNGGMYYLVADAYPIDTSKTKIEIYFWDDVQAAAVAMKDWASGREIGRPDPARMF